MLADVYVEVSHVKGFGVTVKIHAMCTDATEKGKLNFCWVHLYNIIYKMDKITRRKNRDENEMNHFPFFNKRQKS
jgi:hypothetical protein